MFKKLKKLNTFWKRVEKMAIFGYDSRELKLLVIIALPIKVKYALLS